MDVSKRQVEQFLATLFAYYDQHGRHDLPWRQTTDPYTIVVSELMLQQTQVSRVIPKYNAFIKHFPDVTALADANLGEVLIAWQGLGYNRRAQYLWRAAQAVRDDFSGALPDTAEGLVGLPGIGKNTAGAVLAYAFDKPALFVETNIRTVIIHHFFADHTDVTDREILHIVKQLVGRATPRTFYWAMMDYGTYLKQTTGNNIARSKHYIRQSRFAGSKRQVRGAVIRNLSSGSKSESDLAGLISDDRLPDVLADLVREGLVAKHGPVFALA
jgi:A/G-specific adenine glycosylase